MMSQHTPPPPPPPPDILHKVQIGVFSTTIPVRLEMICVIFIRFISPSMLILITHRIVYINIRVTNGLNLEVSDHQRPVASEPITGANKD